VIPLKKDQNGIIYLKNYGKINLKLKEYMDNAQITRNALARSINTRFEVIDKWYNNKVENIDLDILSRICFVLSCDIKDILEYKRPDNEE
jgi:putative transcriptional regulator